MPGNLQFEQVYEQYKKLVYNLCLHYVLNQHDAQDVTQEVFVKIYQRYHQYNEQVASLKTWICRITVNQCLDFIKARQSKKRRGFLTSLFGANSNEPLNDAVTVDHPGIAAENKEGLQQLLSIIYALPDSQKTAIILTKIEDRPQQEVAQIMNTTVKAVESLLQRAKQTIAKKLTKSEGL